MPDDPTTEARRYFDRFREAAAADMANQWKSRPPVLWCVECLRERIPALGATPDRPGRGWAVTVLDGNALCAEHVTVALHPADGEDAPTGDTDADRCRPILTSPVIATPRLESGCGIAPGGSG